MKDIDNDKEYAEMIIRFANDFELELALPNEFNISKLIKNKDKKLLEDIELLKKLSFGLRYEKIKIKEENNE